MLEDVENTKILPKAFYVSVLLVIAIYIGIATVTIGTLSYSTIINARDYVLAILSQPILGKIGFFLVTLAALIPPPLTQLFMVSFQKILGKKFGKMHMKVFL